SRATTMGRGNGAGMATRIRRSTGQPVVLSGRSERAEAEPATGSAPAPLLAPSTPSKPARSRGAGRTKRAPAPEARAAKRERAKPARTRSQRTQTTVRKAKKAKDAQPALFAPESGGGAATRGHVARRGAQATPRAAPALDRSSASDAERAPASAATSLRGDPA